MIKQIKLSSGYALHCYLEDDLLLTSRLKSTQASRRRPIWRRDNHDYGVQSLYLINDNTQER